MPKHEHTIQVTKHEQNTMGCDGCSGNGKTTQISVGFKSLFLCSKCLSWLKNKLHGF